MAPFCGILVQPFQQFIHCLALSARFRAAHKVFRIQIVRIDQAGIQHPGIKCLCKTIFLHHFRLGRYGRQFNLIRPLGIGFNALFQSPKHCRILRGIASASSIRQANAGQYDFYLALHSNASGPGARGQSRGILAFYYPTSANGRRAAELFVENLRDIYPLPEKVSTRATTSLGEVRQPRFPSVLLELGYHDNPDDALWIQENIPRIAANLVLSLTEYFGLPYTAPSPQPGQVSTVSGGPVNLRSAPSLQSPVTARLPDGDGVTVYGRYQDWYVVSHGEHLGYVSAPFIRLS